MYFWSDFYNTFWHRYLITDLADAHLAVIFQIIVQAVCDRHTAVAGDLHFTVHIFDLIIIGCTFCLVFYFKGKPVFVLLTKVTADNTINFIDRILRGNFCIVCGFYIGNRCLKCGFFCFPALCSEDTNFIQHGFGTCRIVGKQDTHTACFLSFCLINLSSIRTGIGAGFFRKFAVILTIVAVVQRILGIAVFRGVNFNPWQIILCSEIKIHICRILVCTPGIA